MSSHRYFVKPTLLLVLFIFFGSLGIYQSTAYSLVNPFKSMKGNMAEKNGDIAYENKNYPVAFANYQKAADSKSPYGQFMLANMYLAGESVSKDLGQYMYWLGRSAKNEYPPANYLLGMAFLYSDKSLAVKYFKTAADKEHGSSMHMLGLMYSQGVGVEKNSKEALRWFRLAKAQGIQSIEKKKTRKQSVNLVKEIQQGLNNIGLKPGPIDGLYGNKTRDAIKAFQRKNGIEPDGLATFKILKALKTYSGSKL